MKKTMILSLLLICFLITPIIAKRRGPRRVKPVIFRGIKYVVVHWGFKKGLKQNGGYIEARRARTNKKLWGLMVYKIRYKRNLERDVQDVFITKMKLNRRRNRLIIRNGRGYMYAVNLKTKRVVHVIGK